MEINLKFTVHPELAAKGIKVKAATFFVPEIPRRRSGGLKSHIQQVLESLSLDELLQSPILEEYRRLQKEAGIQEPAAPAEYLLKLIKKSGMLPNINRVVDSYNKEDVLVLFTDPHPFKSEICLSVTGNVSQANNVKISGKFISKVFDGAFNAIPKYMKEMEGFLADKGEKAKKYYVHYAYCPSCAKKYGHNYMIIFAKV